MHNLGSFPYKSPISKQIPIGVVHLYNSLYLKLRAYYRQFSCAINNIQETPPLLESHAYGTNAHPYALYTNASGSSLKAQSYTGPMDGGEFNAITPYIYTSITFSLVTGVGINMYKDAPPVYYTIAIVQLSCMMPKSLANSCPLSQLYLAKCGPVKALPLRRSMSSLTSLTCYIATFFFNFQCFH